MCTVTWLEADGGYHLFSSRDELRSRGPARTPRLHETAAGRFLAPIDSDGGGTWIAVNDRGLGLTLLNDYAADPGPGAFESRGLLVIRLAAAGTPAAACAALAGADLGRYRPFRLVVLAPGAPAQVRHWDGRRETGETVGEPPLLTSSSYDPAGADEARRSLLAPAGGAPGVERLLAFHRSHEPARGPLSPCMHRDDARTVGFTHLEVTPERAVMRYHDGPPCRRSPAAESVLELPLRRLPATAGA